MIPNNAHTQNRGTLLRIVGLSACALAVAGAIIFMKHRSDKPLRPDGTFADSTLRVAIPDTAATIDDPYMEEALQASRDTMATDTRIPSEAGYEDGYWAGYDDGTAGTEHASYDTTSRFPHAAQRDNYAQQYAKGYDDGFKAGKVGKPFEANEE